MVKLQCEHEGLETPWRQLVQIYIQNFLNVEVWCRWAMPTAWIGPPPKQWSLHNRATEDWAFWFFLYPQPVRHCSSHSGWIFLPRFTGPHKNHFWKHPHRQTESHTWPIFSLFSSKPHWQPTLMITDHKQREWQSPGARELCVVTELGDWESGWLSE